MMRTLFILLRKEFILFSKNKFLPKIAFIFPCMVILVIPLVATMDVKHVGVTIVNQDNSKLTTNIIAGLEASPFFSVTLERTYDKALDYFNKAIKKADKNPQISPRVLLKEANVYDEQKKYDKALECYMQIKNQYPSFQTGNGIDIDAYIARENARLGK